MTRPINKQDLIFAGLSSALSGLGILSSGKTIPQGPVFISGDSRTANHFGSGGKVNVGYAVWLEQLSRGSLTISPTNFSALGGITTATYIATYLPNAISSSVPVSAVLIGVNDSLQDVPLATSKANIDVIVSSHKRAGKILLLANDYIPVFDVNLTQARSANQLALSQYIDSKSDPLNGVFIADTRSAMIADPTYFSDTLHPTAKGAAAMGLAFQNAVNPHMSSVPSLFSRPNALYNPNAWSSWNLPSGSGISTSVSVQGGISVLNLTLNNAPSAIINLSAFNASPPAGFIAGTSNVDSVIGYELSASSSGITGIYTQINYQAGTPINANDTALGVEVASDGWNGGSANGTNMPDFAVSGVLHPLPGLLPGGANRVQQVIMINPSPSGALMNASINFYLPQLRAV